MANQIGYIFIEGWRSDEEGALVLDGQEARYSMKDTTNPRMVVSGSIKLDPIDPTDTVAEWWQKVRNQIAVKDVTDNAAFLAKP